MYPKLSHHIILRNLENYFLYSIKDGELFNLDEEAFQVAQYFTGRWSLEEISNKLGIKLDELKKFMIELKGLELIIDEKTANGKFDLKRETQKPIFPSLRNILIPITLRCNLNCLHCYIGEKKAVDISFDLIKRVVPEFYNMQGLRILISGGEPLLHPQFNEIIEFISKFRLRLIVLTNGTLITPKKAEFLKKYVNEVQISIDGLESHNRFRADKKAYSRAINGIELLKSENISVEVATMIHKDNIEELPQLSEKLKQLKVDKWTLDVPVLTGDFLNNKDFVPNLERAVSALKNYGWGGFPEEEITPWACGSHVCAIMPDGNVTKCQFFSDKPVGNLNNEPLLDCWKKIQRGFIWKKQDLACSNLNCPYLDECKGGCRYRAFTLTNDFLGIDKVRCVLYNFNPEK
ncbi:MAG: radical SAM protein [Candidatus Helarchaeota archaeon]